MTDPTDQPDDSSPPGATTPRRRFDPRMATLYTLGAFVIVLTFAVVLAFFDKGSSGSSSQDASVPSITLGADNSSFTATTLPDAGLLTMNGDVTTLTKAIGGKPAMINMFSSSCTACRTEMPDLEALHHAMGDKVRLIGVDLGDSKHATTSFVHSMGVTYPIVRDPNILLVDRLNITAQPMTLWVDADGRIVGHRYGALTPTEMRLGVRDHLGIRVPGSS